ncbi:hypothetical protein RFI_37451 [Reticulomyxa filosa]|uniref:Transmembrane protein n=1 Tax=Reticulomyxa filosa TaxID=46433 RepID=X6LFV1_RETFI|nr:hypothetical protein RFI_37451 [Reticulomyxa filosa]|eukprot:ETO00007.1 hypothetical protein RFI_37451 [Reticulomyxa filosa]
MKTLKTFLKQKHSEKYTNQLNNILSFIHLEAKIFDKNQQNFLAFSTFIVKSKNKTIFHLQYESCTLPRKWVNKKRQNVKMKVIKFFEINGYSMKFLAKRIKAQHISVHFFFTQIHFRNYSKRFIVYLHIFISKFEFRNQQSLLLLYFHFFSVVIYLFFRMYIIIKCIASLAQNIFRLFLTGIFVAFQIFLNYNY